MLRTTSGSSLLGSFVPSAWYKPVRGLPQLNVKEFEKVTRALDNFKLLVGLAIEMFDLSSIPTT